MIFLDERGHLIGRVAGADDPMTAVVALKNLSMTLVGLRKEFPAEVWSMMRDEVDRIESLIQRCDVPDPRLFGLFRPVARNRKN